MKIKKDRVNIKPILKTIRQKHNIMFKLCIFFVIVESITSVLCLVFAGHIMDAVVFQRSGGTNKYFNILIAITIASFVVWVPSLIIKNIFIAKNVEITKFELRTMLSEKIINKARFATLKESGEYVSIYNNNIETLCTKRLQGLFDILGLASKILLLLITMFYFSWIVGLLTIGFVLIAAIIVYFMEAYMKHLVSMLASLKKECSSYYLNLLGSFSIFATLNKKDIFHEKFTKNNTSLFQKIRNIMIKVELARIPFIISVITLEVLTWVVVAYLAKTNTISLGYMSLLIFCSEVTIYYAANILIFVSNFHSGDSLINEIKNTETNKHKRIVPIENLDFIEFENFNVQTTEKLILRNDFNASFKKGCKYLLLGSSGSGKSTILKALMLLNDDHNGNIRINHEINSKTLNKNKFYDKVSYINDKTSLINGSVVDNICFFEKLDQERMDYVIKIANIEKFLFEKEITYPKINVSEGQRQKILFARALYKNPDFMVLDEALSNIDKTSRHLIEEYLLTQTDFGLIRITHDKNKLLEGKYDKIISLQ